MQGARYLLPFHINAVLCVVISIGRKRNLLGDNCNVFYLPFITSPNATYFESSIYHISKFCTLFPNGCKREYICHSADKRIRFSRNWMQGDCKNWMQSRVILVAMLSYYHFIQKSSRVGWVGLGGTMAHYCITACKKICDFELQYVSLRGFVARQLLLRIYALSSVKFSGLKLWLCKKCDKYEVCL